MPLITEKNKVYIREVLGFPIAGRTVLVSGLNGIPDSIDTGLNLEYMLNKEYTQDQLDRIDAKLTEITDHRTQIRDISKRLDIKSVYKAVEFENMREALMNMKNHDLYLCEQLATFFGVRNFHHPTTSSSSGGANIPIIYGR
jgi:hypothetical protein